MTVFLHTLRDLLADLSVGRGSDALPERWAKLLAALVGDYPADASTLMVAHDDGLQPVAVLGLDDEVRGRRFSLIAHPRLAAIAAHPGVCRFPLDSPLPDPFDGLLDDTLSHVHDCMGVALRDGDRLLGMLTLDALTPGCLATVDDDELLAAAGLLATCLRLSQQLSDTRSRLNQALEQHLNDQDAPRHSTPDWQSPAMRRLEESLALVAPTDMSVLLHGETGVGKERIARRVHALSTRREGPLVRVNCAALPESLIESELFGHRRGAFSGAVRDHRGHFAMAHEGTLMLDEIGELPLAMQPKLLRVLQEGEIQPLGSETPQRVNVRLVAVTNRDLSQEVAAGRFREDLYHRLSVFPLQVPPLRERREDVPLLAGGFLEDNRIRLGLANLRLDLAAEHALLSWPWPGNIRELEHTLGRAALRAFGEQSPAGQDARRNAVVRIAAHHLELPTALADDTTPPQPTIAEAHPVPPATVPLREAVEDFQRRHIAHALEVHDGNWAATARTLQIDSGNLHRLGKRLGLKP
ncbi:nitric oxide reductase transcriptional regulator NorR [Chromohalobacter sp. TMW 2.2308]|uniref:Nitric oxide reductase transcriptional regulator NorR n=1 Tax=Chromohalobacter moromii TaxID=2860329 RepID=A0A9X2X4R6_9GAMM|nr:MULTISPECIES: nitric oxide reductase transcriptional regulator NorR [Chromohalobacter]MCK2044186.1 nitric oxide reductase transcriptional regulator NorR [Chromohalobacter moromii]MCK2047304.1 nitric oxide reductase transcriptional regulator NorR [Chromohalobacter moromii]MCT8506882.1 nitric oxide reductase transcriptional regulator NorR [Chromohalobacter moromii]MCT8516337.1 nitric oxide reductase transcriptional regulator NorR [Chromohalobacter sp. TMW 2.2271]